MQMCSVKRQYYVFARVEAMSVGTASQHYVGLCDFDMINLFLLMHLLFFYFYS